MRKGVSNYFKDRFYEMGEVRSIPFGVALLCISHTMVESLLVKFVSLEIDVVIANIYRCKSSSPDGFKFSFYMKF